MTKEECEERLSDFRLNKVEYPTQIRAYLHNEVDKYVMIWEKKKVVKDANTHWDAGCSLTSEQFEEKKTACAMLKYQLFHVHKHTNRFIKSSKSDQNVLHSKCQFGSWRLKVQT